ncbi:hypothetical protein J2Z25_003692 [Clostridium tertium]|nr:hypothetical protein [Clostridium tertium]
MLRILFKSELHNTSRFSDIFSLGQFHHFNSKRYSINSSSNLFFINLAGFPPTILYESTFFVTTQLAAIIAPSPILTPVIIVTFCPIQTSFHTIVSPL